MSGRSAVVDDTGYSVRLDGWRVEILRDGRVVGEARWTGRGIVDCSIVVHPDDSAREAALHRRWVAEIEAEVEAALREAPPEIDENGVDLTLIDRMLRLTPAERLQSLQDWIDSIARLRPNDPDPTS